MFLGAPRTICTNSDLKEWVCRTHSFVLDLIRIEPRPALPTDPSTLTHRE
jgi:hypothetical protein